MDCVIFDLVELHRKRWLYFILNVLESRTKFYCEVWQFAPLFEVNRVFIVFMVVIFIKLVLRILENNVTAHLDNQIIQFQISIELINRHKYILGL